MAKVAELAVIKIPSNTVTKSPSELLNVDVEYKYRGPAQSVKITAVVTQETFYGEFDEIGSTKRYIYRNVYASEDFRSYEARVASLPLSGVAPKDSPYGLKIRAEGTFGVVEAGNKACLYVKEAPVVGISFQVGIWGIPDFGRYDYWSCYYWDPGINDFVGIGSWYRSYSKITFSNVKPGGYFAVFLKRNSTVSRQYTSPTFSAIDGGVYQYDVQLGRVVKIG